MSVDRKELVSTYWCQFCGLPSSVAEWRQLRDDCPKCGRTFDLEAIVYAPADPKLTT